MNKLSSEVQDVAHEHSFSGAEGGYRCACGVIRPDRDDVPNAAFRRYGVQDVVSEAEDKNSGNEGQSIPLTDRASSLLPTQESGLAGRELDAAVAEHVLGLKQCAWWSTNGKVWGHSGGEHNCYPGLWRGDTNSPTIYISDMAGAMKVVEKMREQGWSFACTLYEGKLPYASFCKRTAASSRNAEASTLPEAICKAALVAVAHNVTE